jgi:hypothetical protein
LLSNMAKHPSQIDWKAPVRWVPQEEYTVYFESLSSLDRWSNPHYANQSMIWPWEERRGWTLEEVL